jgi:hypothetical protein
MALEDAAALQRQGLLAAIRAAGLPLGKLWIRYFGLGGTVGEYEVDAYLQGMLALPPLQRDLLAHAANELIDEIPPLPRAPYSEETASGPAEAGQDDGQRRRRTDRFEDSP